MSRRKLIAKIVLGIFALTILAASWWGYQSLVRRPDGVQIQLAGRSIAGLSDLKAYDPDFTFFGEGRERWIYNLDDKEATRLSRICKNKFIDTCDIAIRDESKNGIRYSLRLRQNELIVEIWYL